MTTPQRLTGKVAFITGADSGIGRGSAIEMAAEGADIAITYRSDEDGARQTRAEVEARGRRGVVIHLDQSKSGNVEAAFGEAVEAFGSVDILMNNAAVPGAGEKIEEMSIETWETSLATNVSGPFHCCREFVRHRKAEGGSGKIINVTSVHEELPRAGAGEYHVSKGALRNLTRVLAIELAPHGINVNNLAPGMILTPINQDAIDDEATRNDKTAHIPLKRAARPREVGRLAVFLASSDADYVTGSTYVIDGGLMQQLGEGA